ncbi:MAG: YibE/F family protein [Lachnospiraceae bacterium]|nr:YibE/F family protein [Lachnospiraceae bacterium]
MKKTILKWGCLAVAGILFFILFFSFRGIQKTELMENGGRTFEKAEVLEVMQDNETESGNFVGNQIVELKLLSGEFKGSMVEATSSSSYLFGAHCEKGMKVVAIVNESNGELVASVYSQNRGPVLWILIGIFIAVVFLIGGKKGLASIGGLLFTMLCIFLLFLPMIYKGISPIFAAIVVVVLTTVVTMILIDGVSRKSVTAILGTILGVVVAAVFALLFGKAAGISGYNVSDIEELVYLAEKTDIRIGELLFAGILIAALGAVMDVGMSIASTLNELQEKKEIMSVKELFASGMNVGRDMMGTMSNTLILAFTGGSLNTLVFIYAYDYPYLQIINMYSIGIELMQGLSASMGVVLTVPFTSLIGAWLLGKRKGVKTVKFLG